MLFLAWILASTALFASAARLHDDDKPLVAQRSLAAQNASLTNLLANADPTKMMVKVEIGHEADLEALVAAHNGVIHSTFRNEIPGVCSLHECDAACRAAVEAAPWLVWAETDPPLSSTMQESVPLIEATLADITAAGYSGQGAGTTICIGDTGLSPHAVFDSRVEFARSFNFVGNNMASGQAAVIDTDGHGTHVTGTAAGGHTTLGQHAGAPACAPASSPWQGMAPAAKIRAMKVLGQGGGSFGDLIDAIKECVNPTDGNADAADVINFSIGTANPVFLAPCDGSGLILGSNTLQLVAQEIESARAAGMATVVSAGNGNNLNFHGGVSFPACVKDAITVGSTLDGGCDCCLNQEGFVSGFSQSGPGNDQPDVCAPGQLTTSASNTDGFWNTLQGTSMASPHVAGLVALCQGAAVAGGVSKFTVAEVESIIMSTTTPHNPPNAAPQRCGAGVINAKAAVAACVNLACNQNPQCGVAADPHVTTFADRMFSYAGTGEHLLTRWSDPDGKQHQITSCFFATPARDRSFQKSVSYTCGDTIMVVQRAQGPDEPLRVDFTDRDSHIPLLHGDRGDFFGCLLESRQASCICAEKQMVKLAVKARHFHGIQYLDTAINMHPGVFQSENNGGGFCQRTTPASLLDANQTRAEMFVGRGCNGVQYPGQQSRFYFAEMDKNCGPCSWRMKDGPISLLAQGERVSVDSCAVDVEYDACGW